MSLAVTQPPAASAAPRVSWLLATHRADERARAALSSCLQQSLEDLELVVVCNGADADAIAVTIRGWFPGEVRLRVLRTEVRHLNFSLNLGLHACRATLVARMDADDLAMPGRLQTQVHFMDEHPDVAIIGTDYEVIDETDAVLRRVVMPHEDAAIRAALLRGNPFCHPSVMFRRQSILALGGYPGGLHAEDYALWVRAAQVRGLRLANLALVGVRYRASPSGPARGSRTAYATVAAAQFEQFLLGHGARWLLAVMATIGKLLLRGRAP